MKLISDNIEALTTVYKTKDLIEEAYTTLRYYYPELIIHIIDNSCGGECSEYLIKAANIDSKLYIHNMEENIGHGDGMHYGLCNINTNYVFIFDSDVSFKKGKFLEGMLELINDNIYGCGWILDLDRGGRPFKGLLNTEKIKYLYPAFLLINRKNYFKFNKFTRFGLPPLKAMLELHDKGLANEMLIDFPIREYLTHVSGGTRSRYGDCEQIVKP